MTLPDQSDTDTLPVMGDSGYDRGGELEHWARSIAASRAIQNENDDDRP